jgi:LysR family hydrogen peroxide-inducible transcriptional activator
MMLIDNDYENPMPDIKLKDLRYLVAVADLQHFGKAAERCFVSQPTLSAQLRKLEDSLGLQLIERQPKRAALTDAGAEIVARARLIVDASDEMVQLSRTHRDPLAGRLRLAMLPTIGPYLLPRVAGKLRKALPRLELGLYETQTGPMLAKLRAGELDLGVLALPVDLEGLEARALFVEPFVLAVPTTHPLARRASVRLEDLEGESVLLLDEGHCLRDQALAVCSRAGATETQDFRATSLETLRQMVAAGAGITLLPELASRGAYGNARGVTNLPFAKPAPSRQIGVVWRKSSARRAAIDAVSKIIAEHALG